MADAKKLAFELTIKEKQAIEKLGKLSKKFNSLIRPLDRLNYKLKANQRALLPITTRLNKVSNSLKKFGQSTSMAISTPLSLAGIATTKFATDFETGMIRVKALTGATAQEFLKLNSLAKSLGSSTQFSATQAAEGMSFLGMAGFKTTQIIDAIPGVMDLASASQLDLGEAADYSSNILTGFGKSASKMSEISDKLTYAFTNSNTTLAELHNGLSKVGGLAIKSGVTFEDMTASMMALADAGHKGETAGVALAGALSRISKFSMDSSENEVNKTLSSLGIFRNEFMDKNGKFVIQFQEFIKLLDDHKAQLPHYQRIFGQDAGKYIVGLSGQFKKINQYTDGINNNSEGITKNIASMYMSGASGGFKLALSALGDLSIKIGETGLLKTINALSRSFAYFVNEISGCSKTTLQFGVILGGLAITFGPVAYGIGLAFSAFKKFAAVLGMTNLALISTGSLCILGASALAGLAYGLWWAYQNSQRFWGGLDSIVNKIKELTISLKTNFFLL